MRVARETWVATLAIQGERCNSVVRARRQALG